MFVPPSNPRQNRLLAALPESDFGRLIADLEHIAMPLGWRVFDASNATGYVYFPTNSIVSMLHSMDNDDSVTAEVTFAANESMVGISLFMDGENTLRHGIVHTAGDGYRIKGDILKSEFALGMGFQQLARRYAKSVRAQLAQTVACSRQHLPIQQLSRWLLLCSDCRAGTELRMTPELITNMLHRDGVAQAVETLETLGLIQYSRGHVTITNRAGLQLEACDCYDAVKSELAALLPDRITAKPASVRVARDV